MMMKNGLKKDYFVKLGMVLANPSVHDSIEQRP